MNEKTTFISFKEPSSETNKLNNQIAIDSEENKLF